MGLDTVEIVLRTEEVFGITLPDRECEQMRTVGDLYRAVLAKRKLPYLAAAQVETEHADVQRPIHIWLRRASLSSTETWTAPEVWWALKAVIQDQLQVDPEEIVERATFQQDLGCD